MLNIKFFKKKSVIFLLIILIVALVLFFNKDKDEEEYIKENTIISNLEETVEVTGSIESADDIDLNFSISGKLSNLLVNVGDEVYVNQTLAYLSAGNKSAIVEGARAGVDAVQSRLDALLAGASSQDIIVTEEEVKAAETSYQTSLNSLINLKNTRDQDIDILETSSLNILDDKYFTAQYALDLIYDAILDSDADSWLYTQNQQLLNISKVNYSSIKNLYNDLIIDINLAKETKDQSDILKALDKLELVLKGISDNLIDTFNIMLVTFENSVYTETVVNNFKTSINTQMTTINTAISSVNSSSSELRSEILYYSNSIIEKEDGIALTLSNLNLAKAKLELKKTPARDFEIAEAEADLRSAQATLNRYLSDLAETVIRAPVAGLITDINFDKGEQTSLSEPIISMIGLSKMQIEVDVPESDITKIEIGDQVDITLDAFSYDDIFEGTIIFIDPAATVINDVIYYKVKVSFNELNDKIKSGMTADLVISTDSRENILVAPLRSIIYSEGEKYIKILENGNIVDKLVITGLKGDNGLVEIISGIKEGDEIITFINDKD